MRRGLEMNIRINRFLCVVILVFIVERTPHGMLYSMDPQPPALEDITVAIDIDRSTNPYPISDALWLLIFDRPCGPEETEISKIETLQSLTELSFQAKPITDEQLRVALHHCHSLQTLILNGCTKLTNATLVSLMLPPGLDLRALRELNAPDILHEESQGELLCPQLKKIDIRACPQFDPTIMTEFIARRGGILITPPPQRESCCCTTWKVVILPLASAIISGGFTALGYYLASKK